MELRDYLAVLGRRWYIAALVPVLVLAGVLVQASQTRPSYTATAQIAVTRTPEQPPPQPDFFLYDGYYAYLSSEYLLDDLVGVVRGNVFANDVARTLAATKGVQISPDEIQAAITSDRLNRILSIHATSADPNRAVLIAQAAATTLEQKGASFFGLNGPGNGANMAMVQTPAGAASNSRRQEFLQALEVLVAIFAGVLLAFLVDYLDDTLRTPETVTATLGVPVIGSIPNGKER